MVLIKLINLKYFADLYEIRNFTEVAKKNFVSQSIISKGIVELEEYFNTELVIRKRFSKTIEFTTLGQEFYSLAKEATHRIECLSNENINEGLVVDKKNIIGITDGLGSKYVGKYLEVILENIMEMEDEIEIIEESSKNLRESLLKGKIRFALVSYLNRIPLDSKVNSILLEQVKFGLYGKKESIEELEVLEKNQMKMLNNKVILSLKKGTIHYDLIESIIIENDIIPKEIIYIENVSILYKLLECGIGYTVISEIYNKKEIGKLDIKYEMNLNICLEYSTDIKLEEVEQVLIKKMRQNEYI